MDFALQDGLSQCEGLLSYDVASIVAIVCSTLGLLWAVINFVSLRRIDLAQEAQLETENQQPLSGDLPAEKKLALLQLSYKISDGCMQFAKQNSLVCFCASAVVFLLIFLLTENGLVTSIAFLVGAAITIIISIASLMIIAQSNYRVAYCSNFGLAPAFQTTFRAACIIGFASVSLHLLFFVILIAILKDQLSLSDSAPAADYYKELAQAITGYTLGACFTSFFGQVSGGAYSIATETGAELVGKLSLGIPPNSPRNPATVSVGVGKCIGEVMGANTDLVGSLMGALCATFVLSTSSLRGSDITPCNIHLSLLMLPVVLVSIGIVVCIATSTLASNFQWIEHHQKVSSALKLQIAVSSLVLLGTLYLGFFFALPQNFELSNTYEKYYDIQQPWIAYVCVAIGLTSSVIIEFFTQFVTSIDFLPTLMLADSCKSSSAANVTLGLALGYISTIAPIILISITIYFANMLLGFYGIALSALGALSPLPLLITLNSFNPIANNAYQMVTLSELGDDMTEKIEIIDRVGRKTSIVIRGFGICLSTYVALALFGAFLFNCQLDSLVSEQKISLTEPQIFTGVLLGAMLPFTFAGLVLKVIKKAGIKIIQNIQQQIRNEEGIVQGNVEPNYVQNVKVVVWSVFKYLSLPYILALIIPLALGFAFGPKIVTGLLLGIIISGTHLAISGSNSGGAWRSVKNIIEEGGFNDQQGRAILKGSQAHKAASVGDDVGSPLAGAGSVSLSSIIKIASIICVAFAHQFLVLH